MLNIEYHFITDDPRFRNFKKLSLTDFQAQVAGLLKSRRSLTESELLSLAKDKAPYPNQTFLLTFDDSLKPTADAVLPILKREGIQGIFFICTEALQNSNQVSVLEKQRILQYESGDYRDFFDLFCKTSLDLFPNLSPDEFKDSVEHREFADKNYYPQLTFYSSLERYYRILRGRHFDEKSLQILIEEMFSKCFDEAEWAKALNMTPEDLKKIRAEGHLIGGHTHTHPIDLASLSKEGQRYEIETGLEFLQKTLEEPIRSFAYPTNSFDQVTIDILKENNVEVAFKAEAQVDGLSDYMRLPRVDSSLLEEV